MIIELKPWQLAALGVASVGWMVQTWGGRKIVKEYDDLREANERVKDMGNRAGYLSMYLLVKLVEAGVEIDEFDQHIISDPPRLNDAENPNMFGEFLEYCSEHGYDEDKARELLEKLKNAREGEDDEE